MLLKNLIPSFRQKHPSDIQVLPPVSFLGYSFPFYAPGSTNLISACPTTPTTSRGLSSRGKNSVEGGATRSSSGLPNAVATVGGTTAVGISIPPRSLYKNLLLPRTKIAGFFDEDARGLFG